MKEIILFCSYFLLQIGLLLVYKNIIEKDRGINLKIVIAITISSIINVFLYIFSNPSFVTIFNFVYFLLITKVIYNLSSKETLFYCVIVWIASLILDILVMIIVNFIFDEIIFQNDITRIISTMILILILLTLSKLKIVRKYIQKFYKKIMKYDFSYIKFMSLIIIYIIFDGICLYNIESRNYRTFILVVSISLIIIVSIFFIYQYKYKILKETNRLLIKNNEQLNSIINDYRVLKHNLVNQLIGVKTIANKKSKLLINDIIKEYNKNYIIQDISKIPNGLNGIIYEKLVEYQNVEFNLKFENKITNDYLNSISPRNYNLLCETIGVTLDNAIDASINSKKKILYISFEEKSSSLIVKIINSYSGSIDIDELGNLNYTSKSSGHGLGLWSLFHKRGISVQNTLKDNLFISTITILKKE